MLSKPITLFMQQAHLQGVDSVTSFHMPGHSKDNSVNSQLNQLVNRHGLNRMDGTTDDYFGNLGNYFPASGSVKDSQEYAARLYDTKASFFMVQGSTGSIFSSMRFVGGKHCHALIQRNSHRSVVHGLRSSSAEISTVTPDFDRKYMVFLPITLEAIKKKCENIPTINLVVITTPTYEGISADIEGIAKYCSERKITLVVDGAHSSVFPFAPDMFPGSGIGIDGVDIVVQSLHKGAGSLTQASIVHLNKNSSKSSKMLENALYISTTTSPSSLILISIEETIVSNFLVEAAKEKIRNAVKRSIVSRQKLKNLKFIEILEADDPRNQDPMKICIRICNREENSSVSGRSMRDKLREKNLDPETFTPTSCLITCNIGSTDDDVEKLFSAFEEMVSTPSYFETESEIPTGITDELPDLVYELPLNECFSRAFEEVPMNEAVGRISADIKSPCPPGCIVLDIGQIIEEKHLHFFRHHEKVCVFI